MAFFDQVGRKISKVGQDVAQSTKNFTEISRLNSLIDEENGKIRQYYHEIGKIYFENFKDDPEAVLVNYIEAVKMSFAEIDRYNEQIKTIKGIRSCPTCGGDVINESVFCNHCGTRMPEIMRPEPIIENGVRCVNCNSVMPDGFKFCTNCGTVITVPEAAPAQEEEAPVSDTKVCVMCGKELTLDAAFCTECGSKC